MSKEKEIVGIFGLDSGTANDLFHGLNLTNQGFTEKIINDFNPIYYFISDVGKTPIIVIGSSTKINHANDRNSPAFNYFDTVEKIFKNELNLNNEQNPSRDQYHIIAPVQTLGIFESHITTCYQAPGAHPIVFDSKINDPEVFLQAEQDEQAPKIPTAAFAKFLHVVKGIFRALFYPSLERELDVLGHQGATQKVAYQTLGTQSFWDAVSCGFHYLANAKAMINLIQDEEAVNADNLLRKLDENPESIIAEKDNLNEKKKQPNDEKAEQNLDADALAAKEIAEKSLKKQFNTSYAAFIRNAWYSTFDNPKQTKTFAEYFLGQPKKSAGWPAKIAYVVLLGWVFTPLINLLKIPTEFAIKALAETFNFFRHQIYQRCPTSLPGQYLRSFALGLAHIGYGVFTALHLVTRTVTSPITSAKAGFKKNNILGALSIATSAVLISALIVIALPLLGAVIGAKLAGASTLLSQVASAPVLPYLATAANSLLGLLGIATTPTLTATAILSAGAGITVGMNSIREELSDGGVEKLQSVFASIFNHINLSFERVQMTSEQKAIQHQQIIRNQVEDFDPYMMYKIEANETQLKEGNQDHFDQHDQILPQETPKNQDPRENLPNATNFTLK